MVASFVHKTISIYFSRSCGAVSPVVRGLIGTRHASATAAQNFRAILQQQLNDIQTAGTYKNERVITSPQKTVINIEGSSRSVINFCANNYLGLSVSNGHWPRGIELKCSWDFWNFLVFFFTFSQCHPEVIEYSKEILDRYGSGLSSVRFICGTQNIHKVCYMIAINWNKEN